MICEHEGWESIRFDAIMLMMAMRDVLRLHSVRRSKIVDFFRISPEFSSEHQKTAVITR